VGYLWDIYGTSMGHPKTGKKEMKKTWGIFTQRNVVVFYRTQILFIHYLQNKKNVYL